MYVSVHSHTTSIQMGTDLSVAGKFFSKKVIKLSKKKHVYKCVFGGNNPLEPEEVHTKHISGDL